MESCSVLEDLTPFDSVTTPPVLAKTNKCIFLDSLTVKVPASRITAIRGLSVVLGCEFSPIFGQNPDLSSLVVTWQRREDNRVVHSYYYVQDQLDKQNPAYRNRTELFVTELSKGNASVRINNVQMQDGGRYICTVSTSQGTDQAELQLDYGGKRRLFTIRFHYHDSEPVSAQFWAARSFSLCAVDWENPSDFRSDWENYRLVQFCVTLADRSVT